MGVGFFAAACPIAVAAKACKLWRNAWLMVDVACMAWFPRSQTVEWMHMHPLAYTFLHAVPTTFTCTYYLLTHAIICTQLTTEAHPGQYAWPTTRVIVRAARNYVPAGQSGQCCCCCCFCCYRAVGDTLSEHLLRCHPLRLVHPNRGLKNIPRRPLDPQKTR